MMSSLFLAAVGGLLASPVALLAGKWGWAPGALCFGLANVVLLLNYSRLQLPHVRRHFEQRLKELSQQQDGILHEVQELQRASKNAGMLHVKASIFMQSVNVIRNINYLASCIKTEVQRAALGGQSTKQGVQHIAECGLRLLLALLPHSTAQCQRYALQGEDSAELAALLYGRPSAVGTKGPSGSKRFSGRMSKEDESLMQKNFAESRKRMWILFRMVHLSSELPGEEQGQLNALAARYLRPVLVERRVPMGGQGFALDSGNPSKGQKALMDVAAGAAGDTSSQDEATPPYRSQAVAGGNSKQLSAPQEEEDSASSLGSFAASSQGSGSIRTGADRHSTDSAKALVKLTATRSDLERVLARLPAAALVARPTPNSKADTILNDVFGSVILLVPVHGLSPACSGGSFRNDGAVRRGDNDCIVVAATGFRYGSKTYAFGRLQTSLLIEAAIPLEDALAFGLAPGTASAPTAEVIAPLSAVMEDEPAPLAVAAKWTALSAADRTSFGDLALRYRRKQLR
eukprot:CAMPEP_0198573848 /NCGR_PEP_ID=MMETSP1462-20131121/113804_1 /TAXON_ID=1333877 /ORGANISM="Brandtodinium nutriculum, Strain RCC3387" /LENGTH=515 /DNA_ID=CAMNT_0044305041 /DNA_START=1 /DNA_END=1544 /DNA_ORIENTATION=-